YGSDAPIVAKIEKPQALDDLEDIVAAADCIMVARGDLGVEIDVADVPVVQKEIIKTCNRMQKPVIVATQMLDSMQNAARPTRAEVSDVANAILDGADACMLSGETAIGEFPVESVEMMNRIMISTERDLPGRPSRPPAKVSTTGAHPITHSVVYGAAKIAEHLDAALVVIATRSGATALTKSNQRDFVPTIAVSNEPTVLRRMCLYWGVTPLPGAPLEDRIALKEFIVDWARKDGLVEDGDCFVMVTGTGVARGAHNLVMVHTVEPDEE
ncbi:MAG: pyruvate kinase, partial [Planctomycetota bacterium]